MADISYTPTTWADGSGGGTPIDATKLNNIESGIVDAVAAIGPNDTTADGTLKAQIDALGESVSQYVDVNLSIAAGSSRYQTFDIPINSSKTKLSATMVYNDDLYYLVISDGITITISLMDINKVAVLLSKAPTSSRTLKARVCYR